MKKSNLREKDDLICLTNPEKGQAYLKKALELGNEQVVLQALHNIIDSFIESESEFNC